MKSRRFGRWADGIPFQKIYMHFTFHMTLRACLKYSTSGVCNSNRCCMGKMFARSLKTWEIAFGNSVANAVYTLDRSPTRALYSVTHEVMWSGRKPCIAHMRVFGSLAYAMVPDEKNCKLDVKGIKCLFLKYCKGMKVYMLMYLESKKS